MIEYTIPSKVKSEKSNPPAGQASVTLVVYDVLGQEIATLVSQEQKPGNHQTVFDASNLSSGIYYYSLIINNNIFSKKMVLLK